MPPRRASGQNRTGGKRWIVSIAPSSAAQKQEEIPLAHVVHHPQRRPYPEPDPADKVAWERWDHHRRFVMWLWGSGN